MAETILNTRVQLKYDTYENWTTNDPVLLAGEVAIATIANEEGKTSQEVGSVALPQVLIKVGDGTSTYKQLNFISAKAADVYGWAKKQTLEFADMSDAFKEALISHVETEAGDTNTQYTFEFANEKLIIKSYEKGQDPATEGTQVAAFDIVTSTKVDKVADATADDIAVFVAGGNIADSGKKLSDFYLKTEADELFATADDLESLAESVTGTDGLASKVSTIETQITNLGKKDEELQKAIEDEASRAAGVEGGFETRIKALEDDHVTVEQKEAIAKDLEELTEAFNAVKEDVDTFFNGALFDDAEKQQQFKDTLKEIQDYIDTDVEGAAGMAASIQQNANAIDAIEAEVFYTEGEGEEAVTKSHIDDLLSQVEALEEDTHTHDNKAELDKIADGDKAKWDTAAGLVAKVTEGEGEAATEVAVIPTSNIRTLEGDTLILCCGSSIC